MKIIYLIQSLDRKVFKEEVKKGFKLEKIANRNFPVVIFADSHKEDAIKDCRKWNKEKTCRIYFFTELNVY